MRTTAGLLLCVFWGLFAGSSGQPEGPVNNQREDSPAIVIPIRFTMPDEPAQQSQQAIPPASSNSGYYRPVTPQQPYQRKCGTIATDVCATNVTVPDGATGEQIYQMAEQAQQQGRKGDALAYLEKSADKGYARAQAALGIDYADGKGMTHNPQKAVYYLGLAAAQGNRGAEAKLGEIYDHGDGVPVDHARAIQYFQAAAAQHDADAEFALGKDYEFGIGLPHNRALAIQYLRRSSVDGKDEFGTQMADALAKAPASRQFLSFDDLDAYLHPPVHLKAGACGPIPVLNTAVNRFGFSQQVMWCRDHSGCPWSDGVQTFHCF